MKQRILFWIVMLGGAAWLFAYFYILFFGHQKSPEIFGGEVVVVIGEHELAAEIADTPDERAQGLSGRDFLRHDGGMLFLFLPPAGGPEVQSFWMKEMKFPIDIIWIRDKKVIGVEENVSQPLPDTPLSELPLYTSPGPVDMVFEVGAGVVARLNTKTGDKFSLR